jgi:hypothetical protein
MAVSLSLPIMWGKERKEDESPREPRLFLRVQFYSNIIYLTRGGEVLVQGISFFFRRPSEQTKASNSHDAPNAWPIRDELRTPCNAGLVVSPTSVGQRTEAVFLFLNSEAI